MRALNLQEVQITGGFWKKYQELVIDRVIPWQWELLNDRVEGVEKSHAIENMKMAAGLCTGEFHGFVFQDSDLYKWLEAVGNVLQLGPNPELEAKADEAISYIAAAQLEDGYLNTYYQLGEPDKKWTNVLECHELYCAGHLIEAAVAYYRGTGKNTILQVAKKFADHIDSLFGPEEGKMHGYPGHEEIELALIKLFDLTGEERHLRLAAYFINTRGTNNFFEEEAEKRGYISHWTKAVETTENRHYNQFPSNEYNQYDKPVRELTRATGHAVRAVYLYTAMAHLAGHTSEEGLFRACKRLWENIVQKQMYINGSIGSTHSGEAFSREYDLPNDTNYSETCASLGLMFFSLRMLENEADSRYADVIEHALYNTVLAGMGNDGRHFFYVNPLEMFPENCKKNPERNHIKTQRPGWYACACCPPNIARTIADLGHYIYAAEEKENRVYVNQFIGSTAAFSMGGQKVQIQMETDMPWGGRTELLVQTEGKVELAVRMPRWAGNGNESCRLVLNGTKLQAASVNGYQIVEMEAGENRITLTFEMQPILVAADRRVSYDAGKAALMRGPLLYCLEGVDNGEHLAELRLLADSSFETEAARLAGDEAVVIHAEGIRVKGAESEELYRAFRMVKEETGLTAIPYYLWNNRGESEMEVWLPVC